MVASERATVMHTLQMERNYIGSLVEGFDNTGEFKRPLNALVSPKSTPPSALPPALPPSRPPTLQPSHFPSDDCYT